jgi:hypothetical protein
MSPKVKTTKRGGVAVGACSLVRSTLGVEGCAKVPRWGLGRLTSKSVIHMDLHKPNNKLVNVQLEQFGAQMNHKQTRIHKTHHGPNLGEATIFPLIVYSMLGHGTSTQMSFCLGTPNGSPKIPKVRTPATLGAHNFVWRPPIEMRSEAKL